MVVAATGPSLTPEVAAACHGQRVVAVSDAYRLFPWAEVLYSCDLAWWKVHKGVPDFAGQRWSVLPEDYGKKEKAAKASQAAAYGINLVSGRDGPGFSFESSRIHHGRNSGFQAMNLAALFGAGVIVAIGFDLRFRDKRRHFFGDHPADLRNVDRSRFPVWIDEFKTAAAKLPPELVVINATPGSALTCFPMMPLEEALNVRNPARSQGAGPARGGVAAAA